jgi:hypothetical protein
MGAGISALGDSIKNMDWGVKQNAEVLAESGQRINVRINNLWNRNAKRIIKAIKAAIQTTKSQLQEQSQSSQGIDTTIRPVRQQVNPDTVQYL